MFFLFNSAFAMEIMDIISRVHLASVVMLPNSCNIPHSSVVFICLLSVLGMVGLCTHYITLSTFISIP